MSIIFYYTYNTYLPIQIVSSNEMQETNIPFEYLCPITHSLMMDPVTTIDGHTFDREAIQQWFNKGHSTNPLTNKLLSSTALVSNRALKSLIASCAQMASGEHIDKVVNEKVHKFFYGINNQLKSKFPDLVNDVGIINIKKLQNVYKINKQLKQENERLRQQNEHWIKQCQFYLSQFFKEGCLNFVGLNKVIKSEQNLRQQIAIIDNKVRSGIISELKAELENEQEQRNIIINLMAAQKDQERLANITEAWYGSAGRAIEQLVIPPSSMFVHITESK